MVAKNLITAFTDLLKPLVRVLIRYGIPYRTALGVLRSVYITETEAYLSRPNKKATISSISVITGLPRSEIKKYLHQDELNHQIESISKHNKAACTLKAWSQEVQYLTESSEPKSLPLLGEEISFENLVKSHAGTVPYQSILDELLRSGCVGFNQRGEVVLLRSEYNDNSHGIEFEQTLDEFRNKTQKLMETYSDRLIPMS